MAIVVVNAVGELCPVPVVLATKALKQMQEPGTLEVHVDNEIAVQNVLRLGSGQKLETRIEKRGEKHFVVFLAVNEPLTLTEPDEALCAPDRRGSTVVAVDTAVMGRGSDELGKALMKGFLFALSQLEELPRTILFYNGGASIPTEGSVSVEDLKAMEAQGVEILTCGTCLDFYQLKDKLAVGGITNMYTIVEKLTAAGRVIKP